MNPLLPAVFLCLLFLVVLIAGIASQTARQVVIPLMIGASAGLFAVQLANVHLMTPIAIAWFLARAGHGETNLRWRTFALPIVCAPLAMTVFLGDLVVNPNLALQLMSFAISGSAIIAAWDENLRRPILLGLLTSTTASSFLGLLQVAHVVPTDLWHVEVSSLGRPTGFYPEPDWLGMYAAVGALLSWRIALPPKLRIFVVLVNLSALTLAFARAAWLGFAVAAAVAMVVWLFTRERQDRVLGNGKTGRLRAIVFTGAALVMAVTALPDLRRDLLTRLGSTLTAQAADVSAQARVEQNRTLSALADSAPWYGHGLSASGRVGVSGIFYTDQPGNSVASNWLLGLWVDGAWLSLPLIALIFFVTVRSIRRIEGTLILVVVTSSFFSNAFFQPVLWVLLAVALAGGRSSRTELNHRHTEMDRTSRAEADQSAATLGV
jgi:O-antigen ligase